jgi:hypothetical protein
LKRKLSLIDIEGQIEVVNYSVDKGEKKELSISITVLNFYKFCPE